jgi:hypothetical protein
MLRLSQRPPAPPLAAHRFKAIRGLKQTIGKRGGRLLDRASCVEAADKFTFAREGHAPLQPKPRAA